MVRKPARIVIYFAIAMAAMLSVAVTLTIGWRPFIGPAARPLTGRRFESTPARLERGHYLVEAVTGCFGCHSTHDWSLPGAPEQAGEKGAGRNMSEEGDFPGTVIAPNITPDPETGAGKWSDDAFARAIREGIGHDGRALFPLMPYQSYRGLSDEDIASVVVYLRSIPAVRNSLPKTELKFPVSRLIFGAPHPITNPVPQQVISSAVERGAYLTKLATCDGCHTPIKGGQPIAGMEFGGGSPIKTPSGTVSSANITPDASGISYYDESLFLQAMRTGQVKARKLNPAMPWYGFSKMTDDDLKAVFAYLRTLTPVKHRVDNSLLPTKCKRCGGMHGAGSQN